MNTPPNSKIISLEKMRLQKNLTQAQESYQQKRNPTPATLIRFTPFGGRIMRKEQTTNRKQR